MFSQNLRYLLLAATLGGLSAASHAQTADARTLSWKLPDTALQSEGSLAVELDGYDVSRFIMVSDNQLTINLETPLAPGEYQVVVLLFLANGEIETLLTDTVAVAAGDSGQWQVNATLDTHYRVDAKDKADFQSVPHLGGSGGINASSQTISGDWQVDTAVQAMYDSVSENNPDDNEWALAYYQVAATHKGENLFTGVAAGHIDVNRNDLLFASYQRRGVTAVVEQRDGSYRMQVFGLQSEPTTRYDGDLTVADQSSERSVGGTASFAAAGEQLIVSAGYIDGEGTLGGAGFSDNGDPLTYGGQSWNVSLDSYWLRRSIWLHGEYAESDFDLDGIGVGEGQQTDSASQAFIKLSSEGDLATSAVDYWSVLLHYQQVGIDFYSIGNLYLPGDITMQRMFAQTGFKGVTADLEWAKEESNTDDDPNLPTQTLERQTLNLYYTPMNINPDALAWRVLGMPSTFINYQHISNSQPLSDAALVGYDFDNETDLVGVGFQFAKETINWELRHQITWYDDNTSDLVQSGFVIYEAPSDTRNELTELTLGWVPGERFTVNVYTQWNVLTDEDTDDEFTNTNYGIDAYLLLIPETLNLTVNYNQTRDRSDLNNSLFVEDDFTADVANFQLNWNALQAGNLTPGINVYLRGNYGKQHNHAFSDEQETWAAHVGLEVQWAAGGQQ